MLEELAQDCANKVKVDGFDYFGNRNTLMTVLLMKADKDPISSMIAAAALFILCGGKMEDITGNDYLDDFFLTHNVKEDVSKLSEELILEMEEMFNESGLGEIL